MLIKTKQGLIFYDNSYEYFDNFYFIFDDVPYEKDMDNGRCYRMDYSCSLRKECDGKLVRRRISCSEYNKILQRLKEMIPSEREVRHYEERCH